MTRRLASDLEPAHRSNDFISKLTTALNKNWPEERDSLLNILTSVNTSGEDQKADPSPHDDKMVNLAPFIVGSCLYFHGLVTTGFHSEPLSRDEKRDLGRLKKTRDKLRITLKEQGVDRWEEDGRLFLSMGTPSNPGAARERE